MNDMPRSRRLLVWLCILNTVFFGCYTTSRIDPNGEEKEKALTARIESVTTKLGRTYWFDTPPTTVKDTLFGVARVELVDGWVTRQVSLPLSDVAEIALSEVNGPLTLGAIMLPVAAIVLIAANFHMGPFHL